MRLPYFNLRFIVLSLLVVLLVAGGAAGWVWYSSQPDKLFDSAQDYYHQAEKLRGAGNPQAKPSDEELAKAKTAYDNSLAQINKFLNKAPKDPRVSEAYMLKYKILWPVSKMVDKKEQADKTPPSECKAPGLQEEAFRSAQMALSVNDKNVEAQAAVLANHFRHNDFRNAYPHARGLIDNLPENDSTINLEDFNDYVIGAYYILALKEVETNKPDQALDYLDRSLARDRLKSGGTPLPRWRAVAVESHALLKKVEQTAKQPREAKIAEEKLQAQLTQAVERIRTELKETVPAADGKPAMPLLATLSVSNTNGVIDVLLTSIGKADSHAMVLERADLLLEVCEKMASTPDAKSWVYQEAIRGTARLTLVNAGLPPGNRLSDQELAKVQERTLAINDAVLERGGPIDPTAYLEMSRTAHNQNTKESNARALDLAKRGLKVAAGQHIAPSDSRVLALQSQAAWLLLLEHKVKEAEEYLSLISKQKNLNTDVAAMRGLGAVLDGRLEDGVQQLTVAQTNARYKDNLPVLLALSMAYLGQGQLDRALPVLEQLYVIRKREVSKNRDDLYWINQWQPTLTHASLSLFKCRLGLAKRLAANPKDVKDADEFEKRAMKELYGDLQKSFLAEDATAALLNYKLARLQLVEAKTPGSLQADLLKQDINAILKSLTPASRNDSRLLWTEVSVILSQPETNPAEIGGAIAATLGAPTDMAVRMGELGRLRAGFAWQWVKAEQRIMQAAADQKDSTTTQLAWVRWLLMNGRSEDAIVKLAELEDKAGDDKEKRQLQAARARLLLGTGQKDKADILIQDLRKGGEDTSAEMLYAEELLRGGDPQAARDHISGVLSKQDQTGLYHYWQGQVQQSKGEYAQAIQSYERSLQFTQFKSRSQNAILACVLGIANGPADKPDKANPEAAFKEAKRLRTAHPKDPVVLLAYAVSARQMDEIYGDGGMEGALADLVRVLAEDRSTAANGPYIAAQQWVAAGRPDRARQELKGNMSHLPSVGLATQLAIADEDWSEVADDLKVADKLQPDTLDLPLWRAGLHESKGETKEAKEIYTKFIEAHPKSNAGYLAMARLHERAKEYKEALDWVKKWREKMPDEITGQESLVRILARDGKVTEAVKQADAFIKEAVEKARRAREEWETKNPITEKDKDKAKELTERRAKDKLAILDALELTLTLQYVGVLQQAGAFAEAEKLLTGRAQPLLEKLPEDSRKSSQFAFKLIRATLCLEQGRQLKEKSPERGRFMDQAIQLYDEIYKEQPGNLVAGNNLAWLLVKEKNEPARAVGLVDEVRKGKFSRQPVSPERLPLEFLDTIGVVYRASGMNQEALNLFKEATQKRYAKEPRIIMYLGLAQAGLGLRSDASATLRTVINLADERGKTTTDPERKETLAKLAVEAKDKQREIGLVPK